MNVLRDLVIDKGCDPDDWTADDRRAACVEAYEQDERQTYKYLMGDAFALDAKDRADIIAALKLDSAAMRYAALGVIVARLLLTYPLDSLRITAEEHEGEWLSEDHRNALRNEADSLNDAAVRS